MISTRRSVTLETADRAAVELEASPPSVAKVTVTHITVAAFAKKFGFKIQPKLLSSAGRRIAGLCREKSLKIEKVDDPRWDVVNAYPIKLMQEFFSSSEGKTFLE